MNWKKRFTIIEVGDLVKYNDSDGNDIYCIVHKIVNGTVRGLYFVKQCDVFNYPIEYAGNRYPVSGHTIVKKGYEL